MPTYTEQEWLKTPLGVYLLEQEQALFDSTVSDLFGFNALQMGMPEIDLLHNCRIPFRFKAAPAGTVMLRCDSAQLPFDANSVDLLLMPHVLEFSNNPHDALREAERILLPEGHLVISGFNPLSLWGIGRLTCRKRGYPWHGKFIPLARLKDWLSLLGFEVTGGRMACHSPPFRSVAWMNRCRFMDRAGDRWWPMMGGIYFLVAKKRVAGMRLIRPNWNQSRVARLLVPKPTQKTECQRRRHGQ